MPLKSLHFPMAREQAARERRTSLARKSQHDSKSISKIALTVVDFICA